METLMNMGAPAAPCNRCGAFNTKFKFFNNKKGDQPRYQCLDCSADKGKPYFFNSNPKRRHHKDGYAKLPKEETEELKNLEKVCDKCGAVDNVIFRGYNNGSMSQPRYKCRECGQLFSPLKKTRAVAVRVAGTVEASNRVQTRLAATSEAPHQQPILPPEFQRTHFQNPVHYNQNPVHYNQNPVHPTNFLPQQTAPESQQPQFQNLAQDYDNYASNFLPQQFASENQQPQFQNLVQSNDNYESNFLPQQIAHENLQRQLQILMDFYSTSPRAASQQQTATRIPLHNVPPEFQNNLTATEQQQFAPQFQHPHHQPLDHNNQLNPRNFQQQQQPRTETQQPQSPFPPFQNNLRPQTPLNQQQQQRAPQTQQQQHHQPQQQQHHQPRNPQNYCIPRPPGQQQQVPTAIQQGHSPSAIHFHFNSQATYVNQQNRFQPASQGNNTHPNARNSQENLGIRNEQGSSTTVDPRRREGVVPVVEVIPEEYKVILEDPYFKDMMNYRG